MVKQSAVRYNEEKSVGVCGIRSSTSVDPRMRARKRWFRPEDGTTRNCAFQTGIATGTACSLRAPAQILDCAQKCSAGSRVPKRRENILTFFNALSYQSCAVENIFNS